jgi:hypothetical protein
MRGAAVLTEAGQGEIPGRICEGVTNKSIGRPIRLYA